ncbi:ROK family protein [Jatrophihabitans fulvus]
MVASPAARPDAIRRHNLALVLGHIHRDGALTRAELTQRLRVSRSTMGALVADLLDLGWVDEVVPTGGSSVGRPSHVVGPHEGGPYVAAVDIDVTHVATAAVGLGGEVLGRHLVPTGPQHDPPEQVVRVIAEAITAVAVAAGRTGPPMALGVSVPGTVDRDSGHIRVAPNLEWHDVELGAMLASELADTLPSARRIHIGNDADLSVYVEHLRGAGRGFDDIVYLLGRIGVGAGIVVNGAPLRGINGHAGEIGHNVIDSGGERCHCGKRGCTETFIGDGALLARAGRPLPPTDEAVAQLFADARSGDRAALKALHDVADPLGRTIATLVNTLNPQRVLLGGSLSQLLDLQRDDIEASLDHHALVAPRSSVELVQPHFGAESPLLGAAELAFADLLEDPLSVGTPVAAG